MVAIVVVGKGIEGDLISQDEDFEKFFTIYINPATFFGVGSNQRVELEWLEVSYDAVIPRDGE